MKDKSCVPIVGVVADAAMWAALKREERDEAAMPMFYGPMEQFVDEWSGRAVLVHAMDRVLPWISKEAAAAAKAKLIKKAGSAWDLALALHNMKAIGPYDAMSVFTKDFKNAVAAHHIVPVAVIEKFLDFAPDRAAAQILLNTEHGLIHRELNKLLEGVTTKAGAYKVLQAAGRKVWRGRQRTAAVTAVSSSASTRSAYASRGEYATRMPAMPSSRPAPKSGAGEVHA